MSETHFKRFLMIIRSAGFIDPSMIGSMNALNFAYVLYLTLRDVGLPQGEVEHQVRRWFVMSILTGRYSGSPETTFDLDIRQIHEQGIETYAGNMVRGSLSDAFWTSLLPERLNTSVASSPYFRLYQAAQVKQDDRGFLSRDITVRDLIAGQSDVHHVFPKDILKRQSVPRSQYNQIANYVVSQSEINIAIGNKPPSTYFAELQDQCDGGVRKYGNITTIEELQSNLRMNAIPEAVMTMGVDDYPAFLAARRQLMAEKIRRYFEVL